MCVLKKNRGTFLDRKSKEPEGPPGSGRRPDHKEVAGWPGWGTSGRGLVKHMVLGVCPARLLRHSQCHRLRVIGQRASLRAPLSPHLIMAVVGRASGVGFKMFTHACLTWGLSSYQAPSFIKARADARASTVLERSWTGEKKKKSE